VVDTSAERKRLEFGDIVVVGGGCYGGYYVRQLGRAAAADAIRWRRLLVVDRDPQCLVAREPNAGVPVHPMPPARIVPSEWGAFFDGWIPLRESTGPDAIVPSPLMPHLLVEYLARRAAQRWPGRRVARVPLAGEIGTPWERAAPDATTYVSHATWTCPINCVEPAICPHTKEVRDWTMPDTLAAWAEIRRAAGETMLGPFTFHCTHRSYGVGMIDKAPIREADQIITNAANAEGAGTLRAVVATASHCHGAVSMLEIGPPVAPSPHATRR
jgi:hypothetical protein